MKHETYNNQGFTLVELLVGVTVFSLVISIAISLFVSILRDQRHSIAIQNVQDNGRYLIEFIAKEVRMSEIENSDGESSVLNLTHPLHGDVAYSFTGTTITRDDGSGFEQINSDEVQVQGRFFIDGKTGGDDEQPRITIVLKVDTTGTKPEEQAEINLQTTLSQRKLD